MYAASGLWDELLDTARVPPEGERLWQIYWELRRGQALTMLEVEAFCRMRGVRLSPWEVGVIWAMDAAMESFVAEQAKPRKPEEQPNAS